MAVFMNYDTLVSGSGRTPHPWTHLVEEAPNLSHGPRARMQSWGLSSGDAGYIDPADPGALNPADSRYVRPRPGAGLLRPNPR